MDLASIPFVQARYWSPGSGTPKLLVIHSMECPIQDGRASQVAHWFAGPTSPKASAHYMVDPSEVWCGVQPPNVAWHVGSANTYQGQPSIGIEQTGYAYKSDWYGPLALQQLDLLVDLVASLCDRWGIPRTWLDVAALNRGESGISTHGLCSAAGIGTDHTDPGPNWPVEEFMRRLNGASKKGKGKKMFDFVLAKDEKVVLFGIGFGCVAHRWQGAPNGGFGPWTPLHDGQPFPVTELTATRNADGRLDLMAWDDNGNVCYRTQATVGGSWRPWRLEL